MRTPQISVVIPAFNEEKLIKKCLDALTNQTFERDRYEIIVVNNNSSDNTAKIAESCGVQVLNYSEKQGFSVTKQYGTKNARADIIAYTDADSIPNHDWLEKIYTLFQNDSYACVGGTILPTKSTRFVDYMFRIYDGIAWINQLFRISLIWGPNMAVRKSVFTKINGFNTDLKTSEDWDFVMRVQQQYGIKSTYYTNTLVVRTSPRKQENIRAFLSYVINGVLNYITIFILRKSMTVGSPIHIR